MPRIILNLILLQYMIERILLDRLSEYLDTKAMGNQFGFKPKLGTDMCIYSLKESIALLVAIVS